MTDLTKNSADGTPLFGRLWEPEGEVKADVLLVHGLGEHIARYDHVAAGLNALGIRVRGVDFRGHGKSGGKQGYVDRWTRFHEDIETVAKDIPGKFFIYGHSMGSVVTMDWLRSNEDRVHAAIICAPPFENAVKVPKWKSGAAGLLSKLWPTLKMDNELDSSMIATDSAVVAAYDADPLVHGWVTPRWFVEFLAAIERILEHNGRYTSPLLVTWGTEDPIIANRGVDKFIDHYHAAATSMPRDGLKHEVHNEPGNEAFTAEIGAWILDQLDGSPSAEA
ncbi:MAG: lysophospholipase [Proteobacteria bacterium]|nr:lysophospholipase [Pseudomonadota bacterium]